MSGRSQRALLVMTMMLAALCADQLIAAEGLRPQAVMEALEGVAGRIIRSEARRQPAPARPFAALQKRSASPSISVPEDLWHAHPCAIQQKELRLPPPLV